MPNTPTDVANEALVALGIDTQLGDIQDGTREAQVFLRKYGQCLRQLQRAAHWDFCRATGPLTLIADASGQTSNVGTIVPLPWLYSYGYPKDCLKVRYVPRFPAGQSAAVPAGNIAIPNTPLFATPVVPIAATTRIIPSRFAIATDNQNPPEIAPGEQWWEMPGESPVGRTVILSNVQQAQAIYTRYLPYPNLWDAQFRAAFVAYLGSEVALAIHRDKKLALELMKTILIPMAKEKIAAARVTNGNEGVSNTNLPVDWLQVRRGSGPWGGLGPGWGWGDGPGTLYGGWDSISFADGQSAF